MENVILNFVRFPFLEKIFAFCYLIFCNGNLLKTGLFWKKDQPAIIVHLFVFNFVAVVVNISPKNKVTIQPLEHFCKYMLREGELEYACSFFINF